MSDHHVAGKPKTSSARPLFVIGRCRCVLKAVRIRFNEEAFPPSVGEERDNMVGAEGFEPTTPASQTLCATRLRYAPT